MSRASCLHYSVRGQALHTYSSHSEYRVSDPAALQHKQKYSTPEVGRTEAVLPRPSSRPVPPPSPYNHLFLTSAQLSSRSILVSVCPLPFSAEFQNFFTPRELASNVTCYNCSVIVNKVFVANICKALSDYRGSSCERSQIVGRAVTSPSVRPAITKDPLPSISHGNFRN